MSQSHPEVTFRAHQKWMMVMATLAFFASAPGQSFLISVFVDDILAGTGLTRTEFSGLYAAGTIVSAASMLLLGRMIDRYGLRVAWAMVSIALAGACGLASLATGAVVAFFALATLRTFGQGSFPLVGTLLVVRTFEYRRGHAMAIGNLGITAASILLPPAVAALILAVGWRHAYQLIALTVVVVVLPLAVFVRTGPQRPDRPTSQPTVATTYPPASRALRRSRFSIPSRSAAQLLVVLAAPPLVGTALTFHAVSILGEKGLTFVQAGLALSVLGIAAAIGTVVSGLIVDRVTTRSLLVLLSLTTLAAPLTLMAPSRAAAVAAFAILGLGMGAVGVANGTVWARTFGTAQLGRIQGTAQSSMITAAAAAPLIPAISSGLTGGHAAGLGVLSLLAVATTLTARRWRDPG